MSRTLIELWKKLPPEPKLRLRNWWFERISSFDTGTALLLMNHGYAALDPGAEPIRLAADEEEHRYGLQLYHRVANAIDWRGLDALEVSCGRGGGARFLMRHFAPRSLIGLDLTANAIAFCRRHYAIEGLRFVQGNAEALAFPDASFDVVISVEASALYPNLERFLSEVVRVLKPTGTFMLADYRKRRKLETLRAQLKASGLELLEEEDISANVLRALELDSERKERVIEQRAPWILRRTFKRFASVQAYSKEEFERFASGQTLYASFVLRKPALPEGPPSNPVTR